MIRCQVCHAWRPTKWEGWRYTDAEAPCIYVPDHLMLATGTCSKASITGGANVSVNTEGTSVRATTVAKRDRQVDVANPGGLTNWDEYYPHQQDDIERFKDAKAIALFWEMGVAKSATILAIAEHQFRQKKIDALLIVAPNQVHVQWYKEQLVQWLGVPYDAQCLFGTGGNKIAYPFIDNPDELQVVCVNIDTFSTTKKWMEIVEWANSRKTFIVLDEATVIKNVNATRTQRMLYEFNDTIRKGKTIMKTTPKSVTRAILTGTPVTNGPMDLWAMTEFLWPNYFNRNWYSFQNHYGMFTAMEVNGRVIKVPLNEETWKAIKDCKTYNQACAVFNVSQDTFNVIQAQEAYEGPYKNAQELRDLIRPIASFRLLRDCVDMPEQTYNKRTLIMSDEQQECYDSMVNELIATYEDHTTTALNKITAMIRLQQISSGFISDKEFGVECDKEEVDNVSQLYGLAEEDVTPDDQIKWIGTTNPKLDALYRDVAEVAKPLIILTRFSAEAARIFNDLSGHYSCCLMTGWKKVGTIDEFKSGKYEIMVANSSVISRGFNLQNSCTMLFYSNTFSLETRLQAEGRIFRLGQTNPCVYVDYAFKDTIDDKIVGALKLKRNLLDFIRDADIREVVK